jgi:hypothetical protein
MAPSLANAAIAACNVSTGTLCRAARSRTEGSCSPGASRPEPIASLIVSVTCCQAGRLPPRWTTSGGNLLCPVNGLPAHARSPHLRSRAYKVSSTGPRIFRNPTYRETHVLPGGAPGARTLNPRIKRAAIRFPGLSACADASRSASYGSSFRPFRSCPTGRFIGRGPKGRRRGRSRRAYATSLIAAPALSPGPRAMRQIADFVRHSSAVRQRGSGYRSASSG